jgi:hypothetical protein
MPKSTDVYGFTYPCPGETIDPAAFQTLAGQIDTKLADVNTDWTTALNRRNYDLFSAQQSGIASGVDTVITAADSQYTIPVAGIWLFSIQATHFGWATINVARLRVRQNGTLRFSQTQNCENNSQQLPHPKGPMVAAAGDVMSTAFFFTGTGTATVQLQISAKLLVRLA